MRFIFSSVCLAALLFVLLFSCKNEKASASAVTKQTVYLADLKELDDAAYPDNPDIEIRHPDYLDLSYGQIELKRREGFYFDIKAIPDNSTEDTILLENVNLAEYIPSIPTHVQQDAYLSLISVVNQEWNRNQVRFAPSEFQVKTAPESQNRTIDRVDVARNCLNSYLWEFQYNALDGDKSKVIYHGWFDFPHALYAELFEERNGIAFETYKASLVDWTDPPSKPLDLRLLRTVQTGKSLRFMDKSDEMYPLEGERKKKFKEIITPASFGTMRDLQSDATTFATFTPPGFYNRKDPRSTQLGRFRNVERVIQRSVKSTVKDSATYTEFELIFKDENRTTRLLFGGLQPELFTKLKAEKANSGWMTSMGISNHPFYEKYEDHEQLSCQHNPYYGLLLDADNNWLDSHTVGIDGPMFHWDAENPKRLHLWLLSFERHAFVGHYVLEVE